MPINYNDIVQYNLSDPPGGTPPTRKWQVNPAKVLQIRTATGSVSNESRTDYLQVTAVQMRRTKPDSIFYAQIAGRVSSGTILAYGYFVFTYNGDNPTGYIFEQIDRTVADKYAEWYNVSSGGGTVTARKIIWNGSVRYSDAERSVPPNSVYAEFVYGDEFTGNDGYSYKIGDIEYSTTGIKRYSVARRYLSSSTSNTGVPQFIITMSRMDGTFERTFGSTWNGGGTEYNLPHESNASLSDSLPKGEQTFELSGIYHPSKTLYPDESNVYIQFQAKRGPSSSTGIIHVGQNCEYFNLASLRVYEIDNGASTFIMKPDDAAFTDTEGIPNISASSDPFRESYVRTTGYGIPNHWWINKDTMYSPGVRCLIPNHNVAGEWIAFGEGFLMSDGMDNSDANTGWSHMYTTRRNMAAMITRDNGLTWSEFDDTSSQFDTDYFPPIVFDWATNGNTDPDNALWLMGGYEREREPSAGSLEPDGDICLYRNNVSSFGNDFDEWDTKFVERDTAGRVIGGAAVVPSNSEYQFITSVCYSDGYFVIANNLGRTNRATEGNVGTGAGLIAFEGWVNCWGVTDTAAGANQINCLTSNDGGSKIMAGGDNKILFSDNSGQTWSDSFAIMQGYSPGDFAPSIIPQISGTGTDYLKAVHNITYVAGEVYVGSVKKGPGVWIACGFKSPDYDALHVYKTPLYAYCDETEDRVNGNPVWHEIDVANDTNLPTGSQYNVRERIIYTGNGTLMTWAGAGPGPSGPKSDTSGTSSTQLYSQQADSYKFGSLDGNGSNTKTGQASNYNSIGGVRAKLNTNGYYDSSYGSPDATGANWDWAKASFWVSNGMSLTDWIQVSAGTPFIGASYSGTDNAPTDASSSGPGNTSAPNVFQMRADGWSHGRYMVGSVGGNVYSDAAGRIAFIDIPE